MGNSKKTSKVNKFTLGMNSDILPSQQVSGQDWRYALNAVKKSDTELDYGLSTEGGAVLHVQLPEGFEVRGLTYVEESDKFVVFLFNGTKSQIGIIDENSRTYTEIVNDKNSNNQLNFDYNEWIDSTVKYMTFGQCKHLIVYWSNNNIYKFADLDDSCCDYKDIVLFRCECPSGIEATVNEYGGSLVNGSYMFAIQLEDQDGNVTNFGKLTVPVAISGNDNRPGENSDKSINLKVTSLSSKYSKVNLAVVKTILGITTSKLLKHIHYGAGTFSYLYNGDTGREDDIPLTSITGRKNRFIKGKNLMQYKSRLVLYNTKPISNLDYQSKARNIVVKFKQYVVPSRDAKKFSGLRPNENYLPFIKWNYCDGTSSAAFVLIPDDPNPDWLEMVSPGEENRNCAQCNVPYWKVNNTAKVDIIPGMQISDDTPGVSDDAEYKIKQPELIVNPNTQDHVYSDTDYPDMDKIMKEALSTTEDKNEARIDCMCSELQKVKSDIGSLPHDEKIKALANPELHALLCFCANR